MSTFCQAPLSMGFSRQEYWNGLPSPPPRDLPNPGIEPCIRHMLFYFDFYVLIVVKFTFHFHALAKEMATHSSILAWRIPGTEEPGGLPSLGSHRVGHD